MKPNTEITLELSSLEETSHPPNQMPRDSALLYSDETSKDPREPHFKGILKAVGGQLYWALAWLRETKKGRLVLELRLKPKQESKQPTLIEKIRDTTEIPVIGHEKKFYGYPVALFMDGDRGEIGDGKSRGGSRMYVTFEYTSAHITWEVPDFELFKLLWEPLSNNAFDTDLNGYCGYSKVWISHKQGKWKVEEP